MSNWISELFKKRGIKSVSELSPDERQTFDEYRLILSKGEMTVDGIKNFCENQIKRIEATWQNLDNLEKKNERLVIQHTVYSTLLKVIAAPKIEREQLEKRLEDLIRL